MTRSLRDRLDKLDGPRRTGPDRLDDSYGVIDELRIDAFKTYLGIDWAAAGMEPADYWQDLCELVVCETHALTHEHDTLPFQRVPAGQDELVETILLDLADDCQFAYEDHQAGEAVQLIAWLHVAGRRYTKYVKTARRLGSDHWRPIVALAESALAGNRPEGRRRVLGRRPGRRHRDHLRTKCLQLTGTAPDDEPNQPATD